MAMDGRQRLLDACQASGNPYLYTPVVLALSTGARKKGLLNLTWKGADLNRGLLTFHDTKNREHRSVPYFRFHDLRHSAAS
jgi:integrase